MADDGLSPLAEAVAEEVVEFGLRIDGLDRSLDVVGDPAKLDALFIVDDVTTAGIAIAWLANAADIDHQPQAAVGDAIARSGVDGTHKTHVRGKHTRHVRVALKADVGDKREQLFHLLDVLGVFGKDILVGWSSRRTMNEQCVSFGDRSRQAANELHPLATDIGTVAPALNLLTSPKDRLLGCDVEPLGIEQRAAVVVAQHTERKFPGVIETAAWFRAIADHVTEANDAIDILAGNIFQYRFEGSQVAMNVADDSGSCHNDCW